MLDPCSLAFLRQSLSGAPFGLSMGIRWGSFCLLIYLLSPKRCHCWLMGPFLLVLRSHLLLLSSIFGVHSTYLIVFEVSLTSISFVHTLHSKKEPTCFQSVNSESFTSQVKVFPKYVTKTALQAHSSCRARQSLTSSISIYKCLA